MPRQSLILGCWPLETIQSMMNEKPMKKFASDFMKRNDSGLDVDRNL